MCYGTKITWNSSPGPESTLELGVGFRVKPSAPSRSCRVCFELVALSSRRCLNLAKEEPTTVEVLTLNPEPTQEKSH